MKIKDHSLPSSGHNGHRNGRHVHMDVYGCLDICMHTPLYLCAWTHICVCIPVCTCICERDPPPPTPVCVCGQSRVILEGLGVT